MRCRTDSCAGLLRLLGTQHRRLDSVTPLATLFPRCGLAVSALGLWVCSSLRSVTRTHPQSMPHERIHASLVQADMPTTKLCVCVKPQDTNSERPLQHMHIRLHGESISKAQTLSPSS
eukprot:2971863-Rhodomonas_salina.2